MVRSKLVLALVCAALVACSPEMTQRERMVEQQVVQERLVSWVRHMNNAKLDSLAMMYSDAPDARVLWPDGRRSVGKDEVRQVTREFYSSIQYMNFVMTDPVVEVLTPTVAVATFSHSTDVVRLGSRQVEAGRGTVVWLKDSADNLWKIHVQQVAVSAPLQN